MMQCKRLTCFFKTDKILSKKRLNFCVESIVHNVPVKALLQKAFQLDVAGVTLL